MKKPIQLAVDVHVIAVLVIELTDVGDRRVAVFLALGGALLRAVERWAHRD
jgi:hypothetical protein